MQRRLLIGWVVLGFLLLANSVYVSFVSNWLVWNIFDTLVFSEAVDLMSGLSISDFNNSGTYIRISGLISLCYLSVTIVMILSYFILRKRNS